MQIEQIFNEIWKETPLEKTNVHVVVGYTLEAMRLMNQQCDEYTVLELMKKKPHDEDNILIKPNENTSFYTKLPTKKFIDFNSIEFTVHKTTSEIFEEIKRKQQPQETNFVFNSFNTSSSNIGLFNQPKTNTLQNLLESFNKEKLKASMKQEANSIVQSQQNIPIIQPKRVLSQPNFKDSIQTSPEEIKIISQPIVDKKPITTSDLNQHSPIILTPDVPTVSNKKNTKIIGTCQKYEKSYVRLVENTDPTLIRPLNILEKSFEFVKSKYETNHDYNYISDQLKSIRQDMVVQGLNCQFTREVYQYDIQIELENQNLTEFIVCISKLLELDECIHVKDDLHFECVSILLLDLHKFIQKKTTIGLYNKIYEFIDDIKKSSLVQFVIELLKYFENGEVIEISSLLENTKIPSLLSHYIQLYFLPAVRSLVIDEIRRSFRGKWPISYIKKILVFSTDEECANYLKSPECSCYSDLQLSSDNSVIELLNPK
ncbi:SAC3/GANP family protein [Entamoeba histolytica KU27]|uniref:SAC3/GANP family protein n=1 Tax=Entamoeba histolytica KU27 TaxID=885311 RepID=M2RX13_ENTHI|nr:SAC3/GANP family protein [Entamoeba histolytica KU27]